jgi:hypothetical protein
MYLPKVQNFVAVAFSFVVPAISSEKNYVLYLFTRDRATAGRYNHTYFQLHHFYLLSSVMG